MQPATMVMAAAGDVQGLPVEAARTQHATAGNDEVHDHLALANRGA
jgi:hypothetical protein